MNRFERNLIGQVLELEAKVAGHLERMGAW